MNKKQVIVIAAIVAIVASLFAAISYNESNSTVEVVGDKYAFHYSACTQWMAGAKGSMTCIRFKPLVGYRVKTLVKGPLFNHESYKVVEK